MGGESPVSGFFCWSSWPTIMANTTDLGVRDDILLLKQYLCTAVTTGR